MFSFTKILTLNSMNTFLKITSAFFLTISFLFAQEIPLPEHPRPDFERTDWINLNGKWAFEFDKNDAGVNEKWFSVNKNFSQTINVPFPWGSALSGVKDEADIAWYQKEIKIEESWKSKRTFITIGASDWETIVYFDGKEIGKHQGGYTPFSFDLTKFVKYGQSQKLTIRVDDKRRMFTLYGKQGYGNARGLWQTVYLEARGKNFIDFVQFTPNIDEKEVKINIGLDELVKNKKKNLKIKINGNGEVIEKEISFRKQQSKEVIVKIANQRLWSLNDPFLYEVELIYDNQDVVKSYFGMRKISVMNLPNTTFPYIALNNKPIYLQLTLDQSYHPEGFYTFPTDKFMKNEVELAKSIGLNGIRTHIKAETPRKLYWADKLGVLVMADLPNSWGEPDADARKESEFTLREMIKRDYNHPAIFSWIVFNETWGLRTKVKENEKDVNKYLPETQKWVVSMYELAKSLDKSRLVEDNSICCGAGHTQTDINSWHEYLPGWEWENHLKNISDKTFEGSTHHFENGYKQAKQPNINSECGNVWGYQGSTGDVDWSYDYHRMMNAFRMYPKVAGWLYTEHHDVINEWNGYWKFDRTQKFTGVEEIVEGMKVNDFHSEIYVSTGSEICRSVHENERVKLPIYISSYSEKNIGNSVKLKIKSTFINYQGQEVVFYEGFRYFGYQPFMQGEVDKLELNMPSENGLLTTTFILEDRNGNILHRNFMNFVVENSTPQKHVVSVEPKDFSQSKWSQKQWNVMDGLKVNGAGNGFFEYKFKIPEGGFTKATFIAELGAKQLFVKDMNQDAIKDSNYMLGARVEPSKNPNSYPMTDETLFPSVVKISANGQLLNEITLKDDPADHRGVLSWHYQLKDKKLREAGSYGYLSKVDIPKDVLLNAENGVITIRLQVDGNGGLAIYGAKFGRYPVNPTIVFE
jgi:hypothetical protein